MIEVQEKFDFRSPFFAKLKSKELLSKPGSNKKSYHLIFDIKDSSLFFRPGDSAAIIPKNSFALISKTIEELGKTQQTILDRSFQKKTLFDFLKETSISKVPEKLLKLALERTKRAADEKNISALSMKYFLWDFLKEFKNLFTAEEIFTNLLPIRPRLYSISNAFKNNPHELHLTVTLLSYTSNGQERFGTASYYLCEELKIGEKAALYVHKTRHFLLPEPNKDIIMAGIGCGIAPFIAFLEERLLDPKGKNWLFFGEQQRACDFYYEDFLSSLAKKELLKLDLAFSRDQSHKIYIQNKMLEKQDELFSWLQKGASFYLCGSRKMADDVLSALLQILQKHLSAEEAQTLLAQWQRERKILKEVY